MSTEKKKKFIIDVTYLALILVLSYLLLQYALPLLLPFVLAFLIAYVLRRPIRFLSRVLHAPKAAPFVFDFDDAPVERPASRTAASAVPSGEAAFDFGILEEKPGSRRCTCTSTKPGHITKEEAGI